MAQEISDGFDFPVGPRGEQADVFKTHKVDTTLVDPGYFKSFGVWHPGEDWNGRGGGDTDLGDPIYAISNGRVSDFGYYPASWGNIVLLEHVLPDGNRVWSQYAHLDQIMVSQAGQQVQRGQQIGTMGKGAKTDKYPQGRWIAHLHFEIRKNDLPIDNWLPMVRDRDAVLANYFSPTPFINLRRPGKLSQPVPAQLASAQPVSGQPAPPRQPVQILVDALQSNPQTGSFHRTQNGQWNQAPGGYAGQMLWTPTSPQKETGWAEWRPILSRPGNWHVWAFIPAQNATTTYARYQIFHAGGPTEVPVNQWGNRNQWVNLGTYRFNQTGGYVRLGNFTGELGLTLAVGFDTICFTSAQ